MYVCTDLDAFFFMDSDCKFNESTRHTNQNSQPNLFQFTILTRSTAVKQHFDVYVFFHLICQKCKFLQTKELRSINHVSS